MRVDQVLDAQTEIDELLDFVLPVAIHVIADLHRMIGHGIEHLAIGFGEPIVVLEKIHVTVDVRHHRLLIDERVGFHQIGVRGIGVDHHLVNFLKTPLVAFLKLIVLHAEAPVRITHGKTAECGKRVDLVAIDHFKNRFERIEPVFLGVLADLVPLSREFRGQARWNKRLRCSLFPLPQKIFDRLQNAFFVLDLRENHRLVLDSEMLFQILIELPRAVARLDLAVAKRVARRDQTLLENFHAQARVLARPVVAVGEMKRINVPIRRRIIRLDDLLTKFVSRADESSARFAGLEERLLVDFARGGIVNDVAGLDALVLRSQPRIDPERLGTDDLFLLVAHGARDVHHVDDDGRVLVTNVRLPRAVPHVLASRNDDRIFGVVSARRDLAFQRLFKGSLEVSERVRADVGDAGVLIGLRANRLVAARLDLGKLQLLTQNLGKLLKREIHFQHVIAGLIACLALALFLIAWLTADRIAGLSVALAGAP